MNLKKKINSLLFDLYKSQKKDDKFIPGVTKISVTGKVINQKEIQYITQSAIDGWLTTGRFNDKFEEKLKKFIGIKHLMTVNSGSSANLISFNALTSYKLKDRAIKKGDEVIAVAAGFPTTINPIIQFGAIPVFIDVKLGTYNIDENQIESAITDKTKAIMLAHTLGNPFNIKVIREICDKYNLWLIEDTCDALGSTYNGKYVGTFGDLATLSFYPAHHITMGEGGAVYTNNLRLKIIAESFRDWGRDCYCKTGHSNTCTKRFGWKFEGLPEGYDHKYVYTHLGYNLKITDMQAACGLAQLEKLEKFIKIRKNNFNYLYKKFKKLEEYFILPESLKESDTSWFGFALTLRKNIFFGRNELVRFLDKNKIDTRLLFAGNITKQPLMKNTEFKIHNNLSNTNEVMNNTFWMGVYPALQKPHLDYMFDKVSEFIKSKK